MEYEELFPFAKKAGFNGFFSGEIFANFSDKLEKIQELAKLTDLEWETSHSTIPGSQAIWSQGKVGEDYCSTLLTNIDNCKRYGIPLLVVHVSPDFSNAPSFELGINRLKTVVEYAERAGIRLAFENINSAEYLFATLEFFQDKHVGFCYDCGHEACHTPGVRYLPEVGKRLFCTHLHDNDEKTDCHWLPFDGNIDFEKICEELSACGYEGNLTLELCYNDVYAQKYRKEEFIKEAYARVERLRKALKK